MDINTIECVIVIVACHWAGVIRYLAKNGFNNGYKSMLAQVFISGFFGTVAFLGSFKLHVDIQEMAAMSLVAAFFGLESIEKLSAFIGLKK